MIKVMLSKSFPTSTALQAVVFDYGTVLSFAPTSREWHELASVVGRPPDDFKRDYWIYRDGYDHASYGATTYWQAVARRPLDSPTLAKLIELDNEQWTRVNPGMLALSRRLREAGIKTAILSNMEFEMLAAMRAKFPWLNEFKVKIYSCEIRLAKPEVEIFLHTARGLRVEPGRTLFLDDKQVNIDGARKAGMQAFLFDAPEKQVELEHLLLEQGVLPAELDEAVTV
jgi:putative hydrolase of the HAD superfamily